MKHLTFVVFAFVFLSLSSSLSAQSQMNAEKQKLISELVDVMKMDQQFPAMIDTMMKEMEKTFPLGFNAAVDGNPTLTAEQKSALKLSSGERYTAFSRKFRKRLTETIDYGKYIREAVFPLYDKFYTEQELKDLLAFYRTTTGQKLITTLPALMAESNKTATEKFVPMLVPILQELLKEEFDRVGAPAKASND